MGAAVRASLAADSAWRWCVADLQPALAEVRAKAPAANTPGRLPKRAITVAVRACTCARALRAQEGATVPPPWAQCSLGRCLKCLAKPGGPEPDYSRQCACGGRWRPPAVSWYVLAISAAGACVVTVPSTPRSHRGCDATLCYSPLRFLWRVCTRADGLRGVHSGGAVLAP